MEYHYTNKERNAIILIFTLMAYLLMIRELKKRHSEAAFFLSGIRLILSFLFQRENKKEHIGESTVINFISLKAIHLTIL